MLLFKSAPFLLLVLPVLLIAVGALFRATNPFGLLVAMCLAIGFLVAGQWLASFLGLSSMWATLWIVFQVAAIVWLTPWGGFFLSVAMADQDVTNSPMGKFAEKAKDTYRGMSPSTRQKVDDLAEQAFRSACKAGSNRLRKNQRN